MFDRKKQQRYLDQLLQTRMPTLHCVSRRYNRENGALVVLIFF